jgi:stage II sporulation protein P
MKVQRGSSPIKAIAIFLIVLAAVLPMSETKADNWYEEEPGFFTLFDEEGGRLTVMASEMFKDDEYISSDNRHYSIYRVDKETRNAYAKFIGEIELPQFEEVVDTSVETLAQKDRERSILLYCTHSDESYVPSDGKSSIPSQGGIYDVAESFKRSLQREQRHY